MIVGHYAASFAAKAVRPDIPLWHLVIAAQLIDFAWSAFILVGLELGRIVPGFTVSFPFDFYHMPFSHSFPALVVWCLATWWLYPRVVKSALPGAALVVALVVSSHWLLDLIVHPPDLGVYPGLKVGFAFWNYFYPSILLEVTIVLAAFAWYSKKVLGGGGRMMYVVITLAVLATYFSYRWGLSPDAIMPTAASVLIGYTLLTIWAWRFEKKSGATTATD